jgi:holo-[acyl-carrier protein] synthase
MHIVGIGSHVVECVRIGRMIEAHGERFLGHVFTPHEIRHGRGNTEHFAGRWAAKEAILQCLGIRPGRSAVWTDVEVREDAAGRCTVHVGGSAKGRTQDQGIADILLTISHCRAYATAYAIAVRGA